MLVAIIRMAGSVQKYIFEKPDFKLDVRLKRTFQHLQDAGYIAKTGTSNNFYLTDLGKINTLQEIVKMRKPDGKIRAVIFDIPEKMRNKRNVFRHHLENLGFKMEQQSVWSSKLPCEDLVKLVIEYHGLGKFTALIVGKILQLDERPSFIR